MGYRILETLPKDVWKRLGGSYYTAQDLDELDYWGETGGWLYPRTALQTLIDLGYEVQFYSRPISAANEEHLAAARDSYRAARKAEQQARAERTSYLRGLTQRLAEHFKKGDYPEACSEVEGAPRLLLLGATGPTIYGAGEWYHLTKSHLWWVRNNGADGDDWSRNNYGTGGAGAIALRTPLTPELETLLAEIQSTTR